MRAWIRAAVFAGALAVPAVVLAAGAMLDTTFDQDGVVVEDRVTGSLDAVALQPDGKLVVVGNGGSGWLVARYNPDGTPDPDFGASQGYVILPGAMAQGVYVLGDGRILVGGYQTTTIRRGSSHSDFAVRRLLPDGALDTTFGIGGTRIVNLQGTSSNDFAHDMAVDSVGRIVLGGVSTLSTKKSTEESEALVRLLPDGSLDSSFGTGGIAIRSLYAGSSFDRIVSIAVQADDSIVALGHGPSSGDANYHLIRFTANGQPDDAFGVRLLRTDYSSAGMSQMWDVEIEGAYAYVSGMRFLAQGDAVVVRYGLGGQPDYSYGVDGLALFDTGYPDRAYALAVRPDGSAVVGLQITAPSGSELRIARFDPYGQPDVTFGTGGLSDPAPVFVAPRAAILDLDGRIVVAGAGSGHPALVRWTAAP